MSYLNISKYFFSIVVASLLDSVYVFQSITTYRGPHSRQPAVTTFYQAWFSMAHVFPGQHGISVCSDQPMGNHSRDIVQPVDSLVCFFRFFFNTFFSGVEFNRQPTNIYCGACVHLVTVNQKCSWRFVPAPVEASQHLTVLSRLFLACPLSIWCLCFVLLFSAVKQPSEYLFINTYFLFVSKIINKYYKHL